MCVIAACDTDVLSSDSYKNVFELVVGGSEILNNLTSGLASAVGL